MSKMERLMVLAGIAALCSQVFYAQPRWMGIEEMFRLADEQSRSIQASEAGKAAADEALNAAKAQRLPDVSVSLSASYLGNGRIWERNFSHGMRIDMPHFGNNFAVEAQQVIYAGGAISSGIKQAELGQLLAELDLQQQVQEMRFLLAGHYLDLFQLDNQMLVLRKNLELAEQLIAHMEARLEQGAALQNDITRYELQREQLRLQLARVQDARAIANHQLVTTLHLPEGTEICPDTALLQRQIQALTEDEWQHMAESNNLALKQARASVRLSEQQVRQERAQRLPRVALVAVDHLDGPVTIEVPVLDNNFNYWYVGVGISYDLSSLYKRHAGLRQARMQVRQAEAQQQLAQEQVENAVQAGYVNLLTAFTDLRTQEKSVTLANEHYAVTDNRYRNGMALLTDMLDAGNMKLTADLGLVNARIGILYQYYKMQYLPHTLGLSD